MEKIKNTSIIGYIQPDGSWAFLQAEPIIKSPTWCFKGITPLPKRNFVSDNPAECILNASKAGHKVHTFESEQAFREYCLHH